MFGAELFGQESRSDPYDLTDMSEFRGWLSGYPNKIEKTIQQ